MSASSAKILPAEKTILFTSRAGIGYMAILKKNSATNQGFQSIVLKDNFCPYFIYSMGFLIKKYAERNASGSTFLEISGKQLGKMEVNVPEFGEQTQIGTFFRHIDKQLNLHQSKFAKLQQLKKAMLSKMFPKAGEKVPEVRFAGFSGDWERKKFGKVVDFYSGLTYSPNSIVKDAGTLVLRSSNIQNNKIDLNDNVFVKNSAVNSSNVEVNDIIVVVRPLCQDSCRLSFQ